MSYITAYKLETTKAEILKNLKQKQDSNKEKILETLEHFKIGNFIVSSNKDGYIEGKIAVKRAYDDFFFDTNDEYEIEIKPHPIYVYDEIVFAIFPDLKIISFSSKDKAKLFGMELLSNVIFGEGGKLYGLTFFPQKVFAAKKKGAFGNVWYNGIRFDGKLNYVGQYGTEIDEDINFLDTPDKRLGLGITFASRSGKTLKVAIYRDGTLLRFTHYNDHKEEIMLEKEMIRSFLDYSNYGETLPKTNIDEFITLNDYFP